ncbi:MAG: hypothetical protein MZV63_51230 [Marinilabiliales bacterium]|nr:hypothetical protein [Marinilabiliales bacterium]
MSAYFLDRNTGRYTFMYSPEGGMSIEEVAEKTPERIFTEEIDPGIGLQPFQTQKYCIQPWLVRRLPSKICRSFLHRIYETFIGCDAQLLEINPVLKTSDNRVLAVDCKLVLDDNALLPTP